MMDEDIPIITSIKDLMNIVAEHWSYPKKDIIQHNSELYQLGQLYIESESVSYKGETWFLREEVFNQFTKLVELLNECD